MQEELRYENLVGQIARFSRTIEDKTTLLALMPPNRLEWALAIADHFFKEGQGDDQVLLHASDQDVKDIGEKIGVSSEKAIQDLTQAVIESPSFFDPEPFHPWPNKDSRLPEGLADLTLAINVAEHNFRNKDDFRDALRERLQIPPWIPNDQLEPPFNSGLPMGSNLRRLLPVLTAWSELNGGRGSFQSSGQWGPWKYISKFYEQLGPTKKDKEILHEISIRMIREELSESGGGNPYDLSLQTSRISRHLMESQDRFDARLKDWVSKGYGNQSHDIVIHLCSLTINERVRDNRYLSSIISSDHSEDNARIHTSKLQPRIFIEEEGFGRQKHWSTKLFLESFSGESQGQGDAMVDDDAWKFISDRMQHKHVNFRNIAPLAILIQEDHQWQLPRFSDEYSQKRIGPGERFAILSVTSNNDENQLSQIKRMEDMAMRLSSNSDERIIQKAVFDSHNNKISLIHGLERNHKHIDIQDPQILSSKYSVSLNHAIRHSRNSDLFHPWGGPELRVSTGPDMRLDGGPERHPSDATRGPVTLTQRLTDSRGKQQPPVSRRVILAPLKSSNINYHSLDGEPSKWYLDSMKPPEENYDASEDYEKLATEFENLREAEITNQREILKDDKSIVDIANSIVLDTSPPDEALVRYLKAKISSAVQGNFEELREIANIEDLETKLPMIHELTLSKLGTLVGSGSVHSLHSIFDLHTKGILNISGDIFSGIIDRLTDRDFQNQLYTIIRLDEQFEVLEPSVKELLINRLEKCDLRSETSAFHLRVALGLVSDKEYKEYYAKIDDLLRKGRVISEDTLENIVSFDLAVSPYVEQSSPILSGLENYLQVLSHLKGRSQYPPKNIHHAFLDYPSLQKMLLDAITNWQGATTPSTDFLVKIDDALSGRYEGSQKRDLKLAITKPMVESSLSKIRSVIDPDIKLEFFMDRDSISDTSPFFHCTQCIIDATSNSGERYPITNCKYVVGGRASAIYYKRAFDSLSIDSRGMEDLLRMNPEYTFTHLEKQSNNDYGVLTCEHGCPVIFRTVNSENSDMEVD